MEETVENKPTILEIFEFLSQGACPFSPSNHSLDSAPLWQKKTKNKTNKQKHLCEFAKEMHCGWLSQTSWVLILQLYALYQKTTYRVS